MINFGVNHLPYQPHLTLKSMVKPNTLVYFVTQLHTCLHAEPDKTTSHSSVHIILHHKMVTDSQFSMQQIL